MDILDEIDVMGTAVIDDAHAKAREAYLKRKEEQHDRMIEYIHHIKSSKNKILLAFLCDATSSMGCYMSLTRDVVKDLAKLLHQNFDELQLKLMVTLYRDPVDSVDDDHESFATSSETEFREFMHNAKAYGGGDDAEDVAGGLEELLTMVESEEDTSQTLLLIHIFDAPAHGYALGSSDRESIDRHNTDTERSRLKRAVARMVTVGKKFSEFEYHYFGLQSRFLPESFKTSMRDMIFENIDDSTNISDVFKEMNPRENFSAALMQSTFTSISGSVKHTFADPFAMVAEKSTAIDDFAKFGLSFTGDARQNLTTRCPTDDNIVILNCAITKVRVPDTGRAFLRNLIDYCKPAETYDVFQATRMNWWSQFQASHAMHGAKRAKLETNVFCVDNPLLFLCCDAFGRGKEHVVFHGELGSLSSADALKRLKTVTRSTWQDPSATFHPIMLKFNLASEVAVQPKLEIYAAIKFLLNTFNSLNQRMKLGFVDMDVIAPFILEMVPGTSIMAKGKPVFVSPKNSKVFDYALLGEYSLAEFPSEYLKWINNNGVYSAHMSPTLCDTYKDSFCVIHAFILYCWRVTSGNFVPTDFQGKLVTREDFESVGQNDKSTTILLTDMACSAKNKDAFDGNVNLGEFFVSKIARDAHDIFSSAMPDRFRALVRAMNIEASDFDHI